MIKKGLPITCPGCGNHLRVRRMECPACATAVEGEFELPLLSRLEPGDQDFILNLLKAGGSLKALATHYGISYPTVRNRLDAVIEEVNLLSQPKTSNPED
jgi:hypothetical protein